MSAPADVQFFRILKADGNARRIEILDTDEHDLYVAEHVAPIFGGGAFMSQWLCVSV